MPPSAKRNIFLACLVLAVGKALGSLSLIERGMLGDWRLGSLVTWATFCGAAVLTASAASSMPIAVMRPVLKSYSASRLTEAALVVVALLLLAIGNKPVQDRETRQLLDDLMPLLLLAFGVYVTWLIYTNYSDFMAALQRLGAPAGQPSATARSSMGVASARLPGRYCGKCGAPVNDNNNFCGVCGAKYEEGGAQ